MGTNNLTINFVNSVAEAPKYSAPEHRAATLQQALVVRCGTEGGNDTVDLIFIDDKGQKHVALVTAKILASLAALTNHSN